MNYKEHVYKTLKLKGELFYKRYKNLHPSNQIIVLSVLFALLSAGILWLLGRN